MPAGVADAGQRVVLGADDDVQRAGADRPLDRGRQAGDPATCREPGLDERVGEPARREMLLVAELRVRVDPVRELDERRVRRFDARGGGCLQVLDGHPGALDAGERAVADGARAVRA